jgi:hypothetical protein
VDVNEKRVNRTAMTMVDTRVPMTQTRLGEFLLGGVSTFTQKYYKYKNFKGNFAKRYGKNMQNDPHKQKTN